MKKIGLISLLISVPVILSGCIFSPSIPEEKIIDKTKLSYTYKDYFANSYYALSACPTEGNVNILVVPVWFTDSSDYIRSDIYKNNVLNDIKSTFNEKNTGIGWYSVSSYYETESQSKLKLNAVVSEWYECGKATSSFARSANNTAQLLVDSYEWYFANHSESKTSFDSDQNGYIDAMILIYGAPDYASLDSNTSNNLWAYTSWLGNPQRKDVSDPGLNVFMWASYDFMYNPTTASIRAGTQYGRGDNTYCTLDSHTYIHEMGHVLGLEDYYDYSDDAYTPAAGFSMQDYNIGGHDPYSVMAYGWLDPIIPTESVTLTIKDFQSSHDVVLLTNHDTNSPFDEYFLVELYTPTGLNAFDSAHSYGRYQKGPALPGIRLWHVDGRLIYINNPKKVSLNNIITNPLDPRGGVMHAFSNSYDEDSGSPIGGLDSDFYDFNILQLIRDRSSATYRPTDTLTINDMFLEGSSFRQSKFSKQFVKGDFLNDGTSLGWEFTVQSLSSTSATISFYKK